MIEISVINHIVGMLKALAKPTNALLIMTFFLGCTTINAQEFTIYNAWDFENEDVGKYTDAEISEDFDYGVLYSHNSADIVTDTINNTVTKVMRITHAADKLSVGFEMSIKLGNDYQEIYASYNWKYSNEFNSTAGGKLPGLRALPHWSGYSCPTNGDGFIAANMHKRAGSIISYHYDRTSQWCPWAVESYKYNKIFMNNGCWYNITQRLVMNTFTDGVANADGIKELWVDGRLIFRISNLKLMEEDNPTLEIDAFALWNFYGGDGEAYKPVTECYGYIDNLKIWMPANDSVSGLQLHHSSTILPTPDEITDKTVYHDSLINIERTFGNSEYGSTYSPCIDETFLVDAGEGNIVKFNWEHSLAKGDYLFFYDGNQTDSELLKVFEGASVKTNQTISSSGRYMFIRFSADKEGNANGWIGDVFFENQTTGLLNRKHFNNSGGKISIYPNPCSSSLLTIDGFWYAIEIQIKDLTGKTVFKTENKYRNAQINTNLLEKGVYILALKEERDCYIKKFIKN